MKRVIAIVRPFRAEAVLAELAKFDLESLEIAEARGFGRQKETLAQYLGSEYNTVYLPKIEIQFVVRDEILEAVLERVTTTARTGRIGDGKVLVLPLAGELSF